MLVFKRKAPVDHTIRHTVCGAVIQWREQPLDPEGILRVMVPVCCGYDVPEDELGSSYVEVHQSRAAHA
jgi:hypothetical protein